MAYLPRAERLDLSFPVEFRGDEGKIKGNCLNVSDTGMLAHFRRPLELWTEGDLWADAGVQQLLLRVRVVRCVGQEMGLAFRFRSDGERKLVQDVVAFASQHTGLAGGRPLF